MNKEAHEMSLEEMVVFLDKVCDESEECPETCINPPYIDCPACIAAEALNGSGAIIRKAVKDIKEGN